MVTRVRTGRPAAIGQHNSVDSASEPVPVKRTSQWSGPCVSLLDRIAEDFPGKRRPEQRENSGEARFR